MWALHAETLSEATKKATAVWDIAQFVCKNIHMVIAMCVNKKDAGRGAVTTFARIPMGVRNDPGGGPTRE